MAQWVNRLTFNPVTPGSSPFSPLSDFDFQYYILSKFTCMQKGINAR